MDAIRILLLAGLFFAGYLLSVVDLAPEVMLAIALLGPIGLLLAAFIGRRELDRLPTPEHSGRVTAWFHLAVMTLLGAAAITAVRLFQEIRGWSIPMPERLGLTLVIISGLLILAATSNLILAGLGIPIAFIQTQRLASNWLYNWTRNPIVLSALIFMVCLGLWMRSTWLILWTLLLLTPVAVVVLKVFEERELEIRFSTEYQAYKNRVPMLFPRIPVSRGRVKTPSSIQPPT